MQTFSLFLPCNMAPMQKPKRSLEVTAHVSHVVRFESWVKNLDVTGTLKRTTIGHFRVLLCLCFKTSLSAKPFIWKWVLPGAIIGDGDRKSWDARGPMIWDNFSIFGTNCAILTSYIHARVVVSRVDVVTLRDQILRIGRFSCGFFTAMAGNKERGPFYVLLCS